MDLGLACRVPSEIFKPVLDIVNDTSELCVRSAHRNIMLSTEELKLKYGVCCQEGAQGSTETGQKGLEQRPDQH